MEWWKFEKVEMQSKNEKNGKPRQKVRNITKWLNALILIFKNSLKVQSLMDSFDKHEWVETVWLWHHFMYVTWSKCVSNYFKEYYSFCYYFLTSLHLTRFWLFNGPGQKKVKPKIGISLNSKFNWKRQRRLEKV